MIEQERAVASATTLIMETIPKILRIQRGRAEQQPTPGGGHGIEGVSMVGLLCVLKGTAKSIRFCVADR
jgi:hypothetical protein